MSERCPHLDSGTLPPCSDGLFRALVENTPDTIARYDRDCRHTYANPAFARLAGVAAEELLGARPTDHPRAPQAADYERALRRALESGDESEHEMSWIGHDGRRITSHLLITPERDAAGRVVSVLSVGRDISELDQRLREREREFRTLAENLPDPVYRFDRRCRRTYVNPAAARITGTPVEALLGKTPIDGKVVKPRSAVRAMEEIRRVFASGEGGNLDVEYVTADGSDREFNMLIVPERAADGSVESVLGVAHEITSLRQAERQAARFFANMPGFAFTFRIPDKGPRCLPFASPGIESLCGLRPAEVHENVTPLRELIHPDDRVRLKAALTTAAERLRPFRDEFRLCPPGCAERWVECRALPEPYAGGGTVWQGIMLDISERKRMEEELRRREHYQRTLIDSFPFFVWLKDREGRLLAVNREYARIAAAATPHELEGKSEFELFPEEMAAQCAEGDRAVLASGEPLAAEEFYVDESGERHWSETWKGPVIIDGRTVGTVGFSRDITGQKAAAAAREAALDEALRLARARATFMSRMSHELRTPMNGVLGFAQLLHQEGSLGEGERQWVKLILDSGDHLLGLINEVLDFAKIEADRIDLSHDRVELAPLLATVSGIIRVKTEEKGLTFVVHAEPALPAAIDGDELRLRQVLLNLLGNAVKFTDRGRIELHADRPAEGRIRFAVRDSGIGIEPDQLAAIFEPFEQLGDARHTTQGTGLGLAISRRLVRLMGGEITVESLPGEGSRFTFELPLESAAAPTPAVVVGAPPEATPIATERGEAAAPDAVADDPAPLVLPPADELAALLELAHRGNPRGCARHAAELAAAETRYRPFAERLGALAKRYDTRAMEALLEREIHPPKEGPQPTDPPEESNP